MTNEFYRPVQPIPWGVFNINDQIKVDLIREYYDCYPPREEIGYRLDAPIAYSLNPSIGAQFVSLKVVYLKGGGAQQSVRGLVNHSQATYLVDYFSPPLAPWNLGAPDVGLEFVIKINSPVKNSDDEIVFYKVYHNVGIADSYFYDDCID